jgi:hypothetical protein
MRFKQFCFSVGFFLGLVTFPSKVKAVEVPQIIQVEEEIQTVEIHLNAFIPNNLPITRKVLVGKYKGQTAIPGPLENIFLDDQRQFDSDGRASVRMQSKASVNLNTGKVLSTGRVQKSIEIDPTTGNVDCIGTRYTEKTNTTLPFRVVNRQQFPHGQGTTTVTTLGVDASARNSCFTFAWAIDYQGTVQITVTKEPGSSLVSVSFNGYVDDFPAYEMYVGVNNSNKRIPLFKRMVPVSNTPHSLIGDATT